MALNTHSNEDIPKIRDTQGPDRIANYFSSGHGRSGGGSGLASGRGTVMSKQVTARYLLPQRKRVA
jgi:hypothetical protein